MPLSSLDAARLHPGSHKQDGPGANVAHARQEAAHHPSAAHPPAKASHTWRFQTTGTGGGRLAEAGAQLGALGFGPEKRKEGATVRRQGQRAGGSRLTCGVEARSRACTDNNQGS